LECVAQSGISLFILAREYSEEVLKTLVVNKLHSTLKVGVAYLTLESDEYSDILLDVSMQTGSYLFTDERKLEQGKLEQLRKAKRIDISRDFIDIFGAQTETNLAQKHLRDLQMKLKSSDNEQTSRITERINALQTEFAMILTGGFSEGEIKESARAISAILSEIRDSNETFREDIP
jgi:chaperonin GroEL (HSP60 family)